MARRKRHKRRQAVQLTDEQLIQQYLAAHGPTPCPLRWAEGAIQPHYRHALSGAEPIATCDLVVGSGRTGRHALDRLLKKFKCQGVQVTVAVLRKSHRNGPVR